jgi:hypothetical protein
VGLDTRQDVCECCNVDHQFSTVLLLRGTIGGCAEGHATAWPAHR